MQNEKEKIREYKIRRDARLAKRGLSGRGGSRMDCVDTFYERRNQRRIKKKLPEITRENTRIAIDKRGEKWYNNSGREERMDSNTRLAFGLCEKNGIHLPKGATPKDAWDALAKKGITPDSAYSSLGGETNNKRGSQKPYKSSQTYEKYKSEAVKKISGLFPSDPKYSTGINYRKREVSLKIQSAEAQSLFNELQGGANITVEELKNHPVVKQLDEISDKCTDALGGPTININTPEREELRREIGERFLSLGAARVNPETGKTEAFDGEVKREFKAVIYTGLPAVGKSTAVDPLSASMGAFVFDNDTIKGMIPEFEATGGAAAGAVHQESSAIQKACMKEFMAGGKRNGDNIAYPCIGDRIDKLMGNIKMFEDAGYNVEVRCLNAPAEKSVGRAMARAIESGRIIHSSVILDYQDKPTRVYKELEKYDAANGTHYAANISDAQ